MSLFTTKVVLFVTSLFSSALFAFLETAFTAQRLFKIKEVSSRTRKFKRLFEVWENSPRRILITILIASNLSGVLASVLVTDIVQEILGDTGVALAIGVCTATALILVGEIIPKGFAKAHPEMMFGPSLWILNLLFYGFYVAVSLLTKCTDLVTDLFGGKGAAEKSDVISEKEIEFLIDYSDEKGVIEAEKSEMLQNIFSLGDTIAKEIMIPTNDVIAIDVDETLEKAMNIFTEHKFTRLPVYKDKEDNFVGMIHQKDIFEMLYKKQTKPLSELLIPIFFVPETNKVNQLLRDFLKKRVHMAMVVNEHGDVSGLVTLEDIIEEIVGEIIDEHEEVQQEIVPLDEGGWLVDARVDLEKLEELLDIKIDIEESVTLGGFLAEKLQHLPKKGERVFYEGYCFQVQSASENRVRQVLVFEDTESD